MEPTILFEDSSLLVISKPAGMIVNDAATTTGVETVQSWFTKRMDNFSGASVDSEFFQKGGVVHRLDKDTSGVMVLAKTEAAYTHLKQQFLERKTVKKYMALVHGTFTKTEGELSVPMMRHPADRHKFTVGGDLSRTAITEWKVIKTYQKHALVELTPHTGRTHQLRVHMQYLHHPMVSDPIYGFQKTWKDDLAWCSRLFLHAKYLEFVHPESGEVVHFESKLPLELEAALSYLIH